MLSVQHFVTTKHFKGNNYAIRNVKAAKVKHIQRLIPMIVIMCTCKFIIGP